MPAQSVLIPPSLPPSGPASVPGGVTPPPPGPAPPPAPPPQATKPAITRIQPAQRMPAPQLRAERCASAARQASPRPSARGFPVHCAADPERRQDMRGLQPPLLFEAQPPAPAQLVADRVQDLKRSRRVHQP